MIVIDTNVISELMRPRPDPVVVQWFEAQESETLWISAITVGELTYGIAAMPTGRRKNDLQTKLDAAIQEAFPGRIHAYDADCAVLYGRIMSNRKTAGRPMSVPDAQIAAIAVRHGADVATRNVSDFSGLDLPLINPFQPTQSPP